MSKVFKYILLALPLLFPGKTTYGQAPDSTFVQDSTKVAQVYTDIRNLIDNADSLRLRYNFKASVAQYENAIEATTDSLLKAEIDNAAMLSRNGLNMTGFCSSPVVVAKQKFPLHNFFLFYPLEENSWRKTPNALDTLGKGSIVGAMYIPEGAESIYFTKQDEEGIRNIYYTQLKDTLWSVPELIGEHLTSSSDEIFPMISPDGKSLYFASKGLYGMGGYDLYESKWNEERQEWDTPANMGFPYSSPYDDFLFVNTPDGKYSMFASNRECSSDSVYIYVLEYDSMPVRTAVDSPEELQKLSNLNPVDDPTRMDNGSAIGGGDSDVDTKKYTEKMTEVRSLRDSIYTYGHSIDLARAALAEASEEEKKSLIESIRIREERLPALQDSLSAATKELQEIEMEFLSSGLVIDPEKVQKTVDRQIVGASSAYTFTMNNYGKNLDLEVEVPIPSFDYSFMILPEGRFAENNTLPSGLVYQIQIFTQSRKATVQEINGISPVFERVNSSRTYTYYAGLFRSHKDVLDNLNKVKNRGFRTAFIVAFLDGAPISVKEAKVIENTVRELFQIRIFPANGSSLDDSTITTIRSISDFDLSKTMDAGVVSYILGPFDSKEEVDKAAEALKAAGISNLSIETIDKTSEGE